MRRFAFSPLSSLLIAGIMLFPRLVWALELEPIADNLYLHHSHKQVEGFGLVDANGLVVISGKEAFVIDTPWTDEDAQELIEWARARGLVIKGVLATHWHEDRAGSFAVFEQAGIATISSDKTQSLLRQQQKTPATETFSGERAPFFGGRVEVFYPGAGHTMDNLVVYLPGEKLLYGGCLFRALDTNTMGFTGDGDIHAWAASVDAVAAAYPEAVTLVPGHGAQGDSSLLTHTRALVMQSLAK